MSEHERLTGAPTDLGGGPPSTDILAGPPGFGIPVDGEVLVTHSGFSPRYDLDRATGVISRAGHDLEGISIGGRILVVTAAKGGVAAGWAMYDLRERGLAPAAMVFDRVNPVFVQGCVMADIPIVAGLQPSAVAALRSGQRIRLDPAAGRLQVLTPADHADP